MTTMEADNQETTNKFYSQRAITIASYFGGPLAAGILIRKNFINLDKESHAKYALIIGITSTILIFGGIFSIPKDIIDKIPNILIPLVYTGIIYLVNERYQGKTLKEHKENKGEFYSAWKAIGIGLICSAILIGAIVCYSFIAPDDFDKKKYDEGLATIAKNEEKALELFDMLRTTTDEKSITFIEEQGIPYWMTNLKILEETDKIEGLYDQFKKQNQILKTYCNLRIEQYNVINKALKEKSRSYNQQIKDLSEKIEKELSKLK